MQNKEHFDVLIVVTPSDCERLLPLYPRLIDNFDYGQLCFIGSPKVGEIARADKNIGDKVKWVDENAILPFDDVHACIAKKLESILEGKPLARGVTGWYYQQFLKMQYAYICEDTYYMVWDGDTVPCKKVNMFSEETGQPYLDLKHELHPLYFETMGKILPGFRKVIERSFVSEHMLMRCDIMRALIEDIEKNDAIPGTRFWEKIINCVEPKMIYDSAFSEFETYGTYVALKQPDVYKLREWHSFRMGASFFDMNTICDRDFAWLAKDFDAISFEKGDPIREDNRNLFDNPYYQERLSAKQMLQAAQLEYFDGYQEVWADDDKNMKNANVRVEGYHEAKDNLLDKKFLIVIVSYNFRVFLEKSIENIKNLLKFNSYKIVVVDNASDDGIEDYFAENKDVIFIKNDKNVGFGPACNQAVKATVGTEYEDYDVFLLNNDAMITANTVNLLKKALYSSDDIGAAGSYANLAGNRQQKDMEFPEIDDYLRYGNGIDIYEEDTYIERVRLSGFAMLIRRKLWDDIGGFDEDFVPGYFEDDSLSMEIARRGYRMIAVKNSFVYHAGSMSFSKTDFSEYEQKNLRLFKDKYGFNPIKYAYADEVMLSKLQYGKDDEFYVLEYGSGLGADLKAIRSKYANSHVMGIEIDESLRSISAHTEKIFPDIDSAVRELGSGIIDVLIIDVDDVTALSQAEKESLISLCKQDAVLLNTNRKYIDYPFDEVKVYKWNPDVLWEQGIVPELYVKLMELMADHGIINTISYSLIEDKESMSKAGLSGLMLDDDLVGNIGVDSDEEKLDIDSSEIIPYIIVHYERFLARDTQRTTLEYYKSCEKKVADRKNYSSEEEFLKNSDIHITINKNCLDEIDFIEDLILHADKLNYTARIDGKKALTKLLSNEWNDAAYIRVRDRYGDYGVVGFYCFNTRDKEMLHFLFSDKVVGMGIEDYVYNLLESPTFTASDKAVHKLESGKKPTWIIEDVEDNITEESSDDRRLKILIKGSPDLKAVEGYLEGGRVTSEYSEGDCSVCDVIADAGSTRLFSGEYNVIIYSLINDNTEDFEEFLKGLDHIYAGVKGKPMIVLLLGSDKALLDDEESRAIAESNSFVNPIMEEYAQDHDRVRVINVTEFISGIDDFSGDMKHFSNNVYYEIAGRICEYINKL